MKTKYKVITGIFEGHPFNGFEVLIAGERRISDEDSIGRSYPVENCEVIFHTPDADRQTIFERYNQTDCMGNVFSDADDGL